MSFLEYKAEEEGHGHSGRIVGVDVELPDDFSARGKVVSVGLCAIDLKGRVIDSLQVVFPVKWPLFDMEHKVVDYGDFGKRCFEEFWMSSVTPECRKFNSTPTVKTVQDGIQLISAFADRQTESTIYTSDCPSVDFSVVDAILFSAGRRGINWIPGKSQWTRLPVEDCMGRAEMFMDPEYIEAVRGIYRNHTHEPLADATCHALTMRLVLKYLCEKKVDNWLIRGMDLEHFEP